MSLANIILPAGNNGAYSGTDSWKRIGVNYINSGTTTCDNLQSNFIDCNTLYVNNTPYSPGATGPTGPAGPSGPQCTKRYNIDMSSNPEPLGPGLIVTAASTQSPNTFYVPLTLSTGLGLASAYDIDPDAYMTFNGTDSFTCNVEGSYNIGTNMPCLNYAGNTPASIFTQILINGTSIFASAPGYTDACTPIMSFSGTPVDPAFDSGCILDASTNIYLNVGDVISFSIWITGSDEVVLSFIGCVWINLISSSGGIPGPTGPSGPTGPAGPSAASFEGICVHLNNDLTYTADTDVTDYAADFTSNFYTNSNFNLSTGEYTVPEDGYYTILLSQGNDITDFYIVYDGTPLQGANAGESSTLLQFTPYLLSGNVITIRSSESGTIPKLNSNTSSINYCLSITRVGGIQGPSGPTGPTGPAGTPQSEGFNVHLDSNQTPGANTDIGNWAYDYNATYYTSANLDLVSGVYTVPISGNYLVEFGQSGQNPIIVVNGTQISIAFDSYVISQVIYLEAGDEVTVQVNGGGTINKLQSGVIACWWSMSLQSSGPAGPTGPAGTSGPFEGVLVHLDANLDYDTADVIVAPWNVDYSSQFYTNANFDLSTGIYTCGESGKYLCQFTCCSFSRLYIAVDGVAVCSMGTGDESKTVSAVINCVIGNEISFRSTNTGGTMQKINTEGSIGTWMSISKLVTASSAGASVVLLSTGDNDLVVGEYIGSGFSSPNEFRCSQIMPKDGYVSNFYIKLESAPTGGNNRQLLMNKNGVNVMSVTISGVATTGSDIVTSVPITAGDLISVLNLESGSPATSGAVLSYLVY